MRDFFRLIETLETDFQYPDDEFSVRIEIYQAIRDESKFRARVWRSDTFKLDPSFPGEGVEEDFSSMETVLVDWSTSLGNDLTQIYTASNKASFLEYVFAEIEAYAAKF